jgi:oxygen-dependent protoporphyrinogen oxidase
MKTRIAVIGAGITGLSSALRLHVVNPDLEVHIFERDSQPGGKLRTERVNGFTIEQGPDAFLSSKPGGVDLSERLGLQPRMVAPVPENRGSFILQRGKLQPLPQGLSGLVPGDIRQMFGSPLISPAGKARLAMEYFIPPRKGTSDESIASFMTRRFGQETWERMVEPLLTGIYAGHGDQLSLGATFPNLRALERTHGGILKGAAATRKEVAQRKGQPEPRKGFLSFDDGMAVLIEAAVDKAQANGTQIHLGAGCTGIVRNEEARTFTVTIEEQGATRTETFDGVVVAVPAWVAAPLIREVAPVASETLASIEHSPSGLIAVAFPESQLTRPLKGYGYVVPRVEGRNVTAMTWVSSKWPNRAPAGQVLVRVFVGRAGREEVLQNDDDGLVSVALAELRDVLGLSVSPSLTRVQRWNKAMPQYTMGHLDRVDRIVSSIAHIPGIEIAGNMLRGVGIPDSITSGETAASNLLTDMSEQARRQPEYSISRPPR